MASPERLDDAARLRETLARIAPGTSFRDGLERILRGRTGALIVVGNDKVVEGILTGGFTLDVPFSATALRELAKMDGAIVLDRDISRIYRANVHLMPDHTIPSEETGTRHRTADRVAKQTGAPVISVSQSMHIIAVYVGAIRYVLEDSGQILARANQALATLERYKVRLDEVSSTLSALEIEDLVTVRDVAVVAQRLEMVSRIAREIDDYVNELGTDGRLLSLQLEELVTGVEAERELVVRDYQAGGRRTKPAEEILAELEGLLPTELVDIAAVAQALGLGQGEHLDGAVTPRGHRLLAKVPRLPDPRGRPAGRALRDPAEAALGQRRGPAGGRRRRRAPGPQRARGPLPAGGVQHPRALRLSTRSRPKRRGAKRLRSVAQTRRRRAGDRLETPEPRGSRQQLLAELSPPHFDCLPETSLARAWPSASVDGLALSGRRAGLRLRGPGDRRRRRPGDLELHVGRRRAERSRVHVVEARQRPVECPACTARRSGDRSRSPGPRPAAALRTTTSVVGIVCGAVLAGPDPVLARGDLHHEATPARPRRCTPAGCPVSCSRITIGPPAQARGTDGSTLTSSSRHSPLGGSERRLGLELRSFFDGATGPSVTDAAAAPAARPRWCWP